MEQAAPRAVFLAHLLADAAAGECAAQAFLLTLPGRHPELLRALVVEAQNSGELIMAPAWQLLSFIMAATAAPVLVAAGPLRHAAWLPPEALLFIHEISDLQAARRRLRWALRGLSCRPLPFEEGECE